MNAPSAAKGPITDINVTPLVDVCLVLVIIFMVLAPLILQAGIDVASAKVGAKQGRAALKKNVTVTLDGKGILKVNDRAVDWGQLPGALRAAIEKSQDRVVSVKASPQAFVGQVVEILDESRQNGARNLAILNSKQ